MGRPVYKSRLIPTRSVSAPYSLLCPGPAPAGPRARGRAWRRAGRRGGGGGRRRRGRSRGARGRPGGARRGQVTPIRAPQAPQLGGAGGEGGAPVGSAAADRTSALGLASNSEPTPIRTSVAAASLRMGIMSFLEFFSVLFEGARLPRGGRPSCF